MKSLLCTSLLLLLLYPTIVVACEPDCDDCWTGEDCDELEDECADYDDCPNGGWCCDCEDCECEENDYWCGSPWYGPCHYCDDCECVCAEVYGIGSVNSVYYCGESDSVFAYIAGNLPSGCSINWSGSASFGGSGTSVTATFNTIGSGLTIDANTVCQSGHATSQSFDVVQITQFEAKSSNFPKCVGDSISSSDFNITTSPTGYEGSVSVSGLTTSSAGNKTACATLWGKPSPALQASYTVVEVNSVDSDKSSAAICEDIEFTATTYPSGYESLVNWTAEDNTDTGSGSTFTTSWSCTGQKMVTATCGCSSNYDTKDVTITLPSGCSNAGQHNSSVHWINPDDDYSDPNTYFGYCSYWQATYEVDFKYEDCKWVCEISDVEAETKILVLDPNDPYYISITQASDVICGPNDVNAWQAKYDLNDSDLTDDVGAPLDVYWIHSAIVDHEKKHRSDWQNFYGTSLLIAAYAAELIDEDIDCNYSDTTTCQNVENDWIGMIEQFFDLAYVDALDEMDDPNTQVDEAEVRAYLVENAIEQPVSDALPAGCTP